MLCPYCKSEKTSVIDSRDNADFTIRRRRECDICKRRYTTYERIENIDLEVHKRSGKIEAFNRSKLRQSIFHAVRKQISETQIDELVDSIELELSQKKTNIIKSTEIGNLVLDGLKKLDKLSYLRFASVYKDFKNLKDFQDEIYNLLTENLKN